MIPTPGISNIGNGNTGAAVGRNDMPSRHFSVTHPPFPNQTGTAGTFVFGNVANQSDISSYLASGNSNINCPVPEIGNNVISHATGKLSSLPGHANGMFQLQNPDGGIISNVFDSTTQMVTMNGSTGQRLAYPNIEYMTGTQLQQFAVKQNGHLYSHMSRQTNGIPRNINFTMENSFLGSTDRILNKRMEFLGTGPHMPNINPHSVKTRGILNTNCNSHAPTSVKQQGDLQSQEHLIQSLSKHLPLLPDCGYAMNAADLMASGNLYHVSPGRLSTRGSLNDITRGMLPKTGGQDSGLSNEQQKLHPPAQQMQMQPIGSDSRSYPSMLSMQSQLPLQKSHEFRNQYFEEQFYPCYSTQQVQQGQHTETVRNGIPNYHSSSVTSGQGEVDMQTLSKDTPEQKILDQQEVSLVSSDLQHHDKCSFAQQMPVSNENMFDSQESYNHQPQMSQQLLYNAIQRSQSNNGSNDRSSQIGFQVQHESISNESSLTENVSYSLQEHRSQQLAPERGRTKDNVDKEQHLPEENSNNNESSGLTQVSSSTTSADNLDHQVNVDAEALRKEYRKQQHFLLLLRHSIRCSAGDGKCRKSSHCFEMRKLADHLSKCHEEQCSNLYCRQARKLVKHHMECRNPRCPVCGPLRNRRKKNTMGNGLSNPSTNSEVLNITVEKETQSSSQAVSGAVLKSLAIEQPLSGSINESTFPRLAKQEAEMVPSPKTNIQSNALKRCLHIDESDMHSCTQHLVLEPDKQANYSTESISSPLENNTVGTQDQECIEKRHSPKKLKMELNDTKQEGNMEASQMAYSNNMPQVSFSDHQLVLQSDHQLLEAYKDARPNIEGRQPQIQMSPKSDLVGVPSGKSRTNMKEDLPQVKNGTMTDVPSSIVSSSAKVGKPKAKGVSLTELFTSSQIRDHIRGLRQWVGQSKAKAEKYQAMEHHMTENSCRLCAVERLTFEPPPVYCSRCGVRVKRNAQYYTSGSGDGRLCLCIPCYNECHGNTIKLDGVEFQKSKIEKKRNDEETEEAWVQCDECESWQHQICALFNGRRNEGGQAEYTCPSCYLDQIERGERIPLPDSAVLGAKDLPRTLLSDHIEQRLFRRLKQEREKRAQALGKLYDEVPGAESLVVRVVSSVDKKLEVKQRFFELFRNEGYPSEYPYKSKVILLFQKIEGVEVCLFGMYVQEYGSDASLPNQRRIYLAYLDSVKYFRPDVKTSSGEALRTFVYHEILIGYLEYCKERGFTSCYIWACPPLKGEDYILYCHPEIQKTPKSDKLREWYLTMLRKASKENIVVETTNLYDYFFVSAIERKTKVTAARLPYFEGDYWPGAAEDMLMQFQEEEDGKRQQKTKKTITKRSLKAAALSEPGGNLSKDLLLMRKLGDTIHQMKEDFIMVHLQHACTHCCSFITRGYRWTCKQCKNFQLCESCHDTEQRLDEKNRHPINAREKHLLSPVKVDEIAADTKDKDDIIESEIFDTRQAFLSLCQGNHYQYDTLRRAKHSSMMILYHLHNPLAPAFVITCNICQQEVETGKGWHCETCPDFDVCNACYQNDRNLKHPHKLVAHSTPTEQVMTTQEDRQNRILQQRKYLELLVHASTCHTAQCQYRDCRKIKGVFRHASVCKVRYQGRCQTCVKTWTLLRIHARSCSVPRCLVPRCRDLKEHFKRIQTQSESRRRAAVNEMMRQRVAEVSGKK